MRTTRMIHVSTASGTFHARVVCARLGAAGILTELRGGTEGPYPLGGCVEIFVPEAEADDARALLSADAAAGAELGPWGDEVGEEPDSAEDARLGLAGLRGNPRRLAWLAVALVGLLAAGLVLASMA